MKRLFKSIVLTLVCVLMTMILLSHKTAESVICNPKKEYNNQKGGAYFHTHEYDGTMITIMGRQVSEE